MPLDRWMPYSSEGGEGLRWRPRVRYGLQASLST